MDITSVIANLDDLDWVDISRRRFGTDRFADWCHLASREQLIRQAGYCTCCNSVANRPPVRAVARWVFANGNHELLCADCLDGWRVNAVDDPSLSYTSLELLG